MSIYIVRLGLVNPATPDIGYYNYNFKSIPLIPSHPFGVNHTKLYLSPWKGRVQCLHKYVKFVSEEVNKYKYIIFLRGIRGSATTLLHLTSVSIHQTRLLCNEYLPLSPQPPTHLRRSCQFLQ